MTIPEHCITHNGPLMLCDQCVHENGMRMRRRLDREIIKVLDGPECAGLSSIQRSRVGEKIRVELEKELPE